MEGFEMQHIKYRKTTHMDDMFRHVQKLTQSVKIGGDWVIDSSIPLPTVRAKATVKLHGTNLGVVSDGVDIWWQSRNNVITQQSDNAGSAAFCDARKEQLKAITSLIRSRNELDDDALVCVYGEFVGKNIFHVGVSQMEKSFFIFSVEVDGQQLNESWIEAPEINIFNVLNMQTYDIEIDFNDHQACHDRLTAIVNDIDKQCPVAKHFGFDGVGEGVVVGFQLNGEHLIFKMKGESHTSSKVKIPKVQKAKQDHSEVVDVVCPQWRLDQQYHLVVDTLNGGTPDRTMIGAFIKAVAGDIIEECNDVLVDSYLSYRDIGGEVAQKCKIYFLLLLQSEL
jgi:hypothetical protein